MGSFSRRSFWGLGSRHCSSCIGLWSSAGATGAAGLQGATGPIGAAPIRSASSLSVRRVHVAGQWAGSAEAVCAVCVGRCASFRPDWSDWSEGGQGRCATIHDSLQCVLTAQLARSGSAQSALRRLRGS